MNIVFIGSGNLATHLAQELFKRGHNIIQIFSRTLETAKTLAIKVGADYTNDIDQIAYDADFYIFSIKDSALENIISRMPIQRGVWIHTAGSMDINIFEDKAEKYGVLYPLQTFSKNREISWEEIPILIEGSTQETTLLIKDLANNLSSKVFELASDKRIYLHVAAVFACNFVNHMYDQAKNLSDKADLPFEILIPLIQETCNKIQELSPHEAQTGPAIRYDENVIQKHLKMLDNADTKKIYEIMSRSIYNSFKK